jgi:hypothetical protein
VIEPRRHLDLTQEALGANRGRDLWPQHLERDLPAVAEVLGQEHGCHSSSAQLARDGVATGEAGVEAMLEGSCGHAGKMQG